MLHTPARHLNFPVVTIGGVRVPHLRSHNEPSRPLPELRDVTNRPTEEPTRVTPTSMCRDAQPLPVDRVDSPGRFLCRRSPRGIGPLPKWPTRGQT